MLMLRLHRNLELILIIFWQVGFQLVWLKLNIVVNEAVEQLQMNLSRKSWQ